MWTCRLVEQTNRIRRRRVHKCSVLAVGAGQTAGRIPYTDAMECPLGSTSNTLLAYFVRLFLRPSYGRPHGVSIMLACYVWTDKWCVDGGGVLVPNGDPRAIAHAGGMLIVCVRACRRVPHTRAYAI